MKEIRTTTDIEAPPAVVWEVLTDFASYPAWNPFLVRIEGDAAKNERLKVTMQRERQNPLTFTPTVLEAREHRALRWLGRVLFSGIFDGEHFFELEPLKTGGTRLVHGEMFTGIAVDYFARNLLVDIEQDFGRMNQALKSRAEALARESPGAGDAPEPRKRFGELLCG
ncbi:MAG TPA: SRPBCC domain-containing protein [bacterium]|nr:SRPBCC domain-containing protein [bacterium]